MFAKSTLRTQHNGKYAPKPWKIYVSKKQRKLYLVSIVLEPSDSSHVHCGTCCPHDHKDPPKAQANASSTSPTMQGISLFSSDTGLGGQSNVQNLEDLVQDVPT